MIKYKKQVLIFILLLFSNYAHAQYFNFIEKWNKKRIEKRDNMYAKEHVYTQKLFGIGAQFYQNQNFSQNQYAGVFFAMDNSRLTDRPKYYRIIDNNIKFGGLLIAESISPTFSTNTRLAYARLQKKGSDFAIGGQIATNLNGRLNTGYQNNAVSFDANVDLGPRIRYGKTLKVLYSTFDIDYHLAVPIVSFGAYGPAYSTSFANNTSGVFFPNKYQRIQSGFFVTLGAKKRFPDQRFKFGYQWDYLHQDLGNNLGVYNATHTLSFSGKITKIK